ncbi:hypothetical protein Asulf_01761 [Archaeoglobus sulfaticallidus PM70-1]|uniref:Uncharacterized protein n=1 Tax=Archaeoglobus sulfaticallidus PM70-1 TaxID=387631 RepID=N0BHD5_9EURY|nr:hypothetical protein [Archaeoglobus sulfaticallidus]AGK61732.1 hypothetical protein Asulf_01761 [Archaeoglobus sulfaticallidus PM70-1]
MSCIFCIYFSSCGGMAEICEHFTLKNTKQRKEKKLRSGSISEVAESMNMTVTEFLSYVGKLEKEGKLKIRFL